MRPTRLAARSRRVTRSTIATRSVSISPGERCACVRRRAGSRSSAGGGAGGRGGGRGCCARACRCRAAARPRIMRERGSRGTRASSPTVAIPMRCSRAAVAGPMPQIRSTGSGCRNASSRSGGTRRSPSGLATALAIFARCFVRAMPTVSGSPTRSRAAAAEADGDLEGRAGDPLHAADVEERLVDREPLDRTGSCPRRARRAPCSPPRTRPCAGGRRSPAGRAGEPGFRPSPSGRRTPSPRSWRRARPRRRRSPAARAGAGSSRCSTDAKNESASACRIVASARTGRCLHIERMFALIVRCSSRSTASTGSWRSLEERGLAARGGSGAARCSRAARSRPAWPASLLAEVCAGDSRIVCAGDDRLARRRTGSVAGGGRVRRLRPGDDRALGADQPDLRGRRGPGAGARARRLASSRWSIPGVPLPAPVARLTGLARRGAPPGAARLDGRRPLPRVRRRRAARRAQRALRPALPRAPAAPARGLPAGGAAAVHGSARAPAARGAHAQGRPRLARPLLRSGDHSLPSRAAGRGGDRGDPVRLIGLAQELGARRVSELRILAAPRKRRVYGKRSLVHGAPTRPGVYLFRDRHEQVLYVGRARDLRARLRSYFQSDRQRPSVEAALLALGRIEWRVLGSELEAALEEVRLIRALQPPANSRSRPRGDSLYLRRRGDDFVVTKTPTELGPIGSRRQAALAARALSAATPDELERLLDGGPLPRLRQRLLDLSESLRYEEAARLRDRIDGARARPRATAPARAAPRHERLSDRTQPRPRAGGRHSSCTAARSARSAPSRPATVRGSRSTPASRSSATPRPGPAR